MASKDLKVKEMEGTKLEEYYLFTKEDLPDLVSLLKKEEKMVMWEIPNLKDKRVLFLLHLVIDLLADADRSRKLKKTFEGTYKQKSKDKVIDSFIKIVEEWVEENNGKGNLLEVIKVLRSNGHLYLASVVEQLLFRYSLPFSADGNNQEVNVYSLSRDFLQMEDTPMGSLPLWNANPVEQALQNSVILEEVFRKLKPSDQKVFRLVSSTWMNETLSYWRRSSLLQLCVPRDADDKKVKGISMTSFVKLLELEGSARKRKGKNFELTEHPFHRYQLSYYTGSDRYGKQIPLSCGQKEAKFWQLCGPHIEDLEVDNAYFDGRSAAENTVEKFCQKIFLDTCPKLKKFKIGSLCSVSHPPLMQSQPNFVATKVASNLHTLTVEVDIQEQVLRKILGLCPNLKTLILRTNTEHSRAHLPTTSNGECIKLKKLVIKYFGAVTPDDRILPLRNYSEMLSKKGFSCLQHLTLEGLHLWEAKRPPFSLYAALAKFSQSLKTLELKMSVCGYLRDHATGDAKWFTELSSCAFPDLTELKLCFRLAVNPKNIFHFDFGTLKGMPKLERFELRMVRAETFERNPGTQDWVFDGDRKPYLPEGITLDYVYSKEEPILCKNLKEFTFVGGWSLNNEDIKLLSVWFPYLTHLKAAVELEFVPLLLENFIQLDKLDLETKGMVSLGDLRRLRERKKGVRICQTISGRFHQSVEMKEHNGRLYFADRNSE